MLITTIRNFDATSKVLRLHTADNATETDVDANQEARKTRKLRFSAGQAPIADVELDDIPYYWAGTEWVNATGQTLPLLFAEMMFGSMSSDGEILHTLRVKTGTAAYLYSISYPKFGGESIVHDPTYSVVAAIAGESSGTTTSTGSTGSASSTTEDSAIPGFELLALVAIPVVVLVRRSELLRPRS